MNCKGCTKRHATCHAHCEEYQNWCIEQAKLKTAIKLERQAEFYEIEKWKSNKHRQAKLKQGDRSCGRKRFKE